MRAATPQVHPLKIEIPTVKARSNLDERSAFNFQIFCLVGLNRYRTVCTKCDVRIYAVGDAGRIQVKKAKEHQPGRGVSRLFEKLSTNAASGELSVPS
jgi:hypothetical protein